MFKLLRKRTKLQDKEKPKQDGPGDGVALPPAANASTAIIVSKPENDPEPAAPVLDDEDEKFLEHLTTGSGSAGQHGAPPLPPRLTTPDRTWDEDTESFRKLDVVGKGKEREKPPKAKPAAKKTNRLSIFLRKEKKASGEVVKGEDAELTVPVDSEADREAHELTRVLHDLNLAARNNKVFSLSEESAELVRKFTLVLKDLVNGVPTAAHDLVALLHDSDGTISKNFEKLPASFQKLVTQLPNKLSTMLAPEILAIAAEAQVISKEDAQAQGGLKGAAKNMFLPRNLADLITKPGAVAGMLKAIMNALKTRFPAFIGTNVLWSLAVFLLLIVLWYCHKRGREARLDREKMHVDEEVPAAAAVDRGESLAPAAGDLNMQGSSHAGADPVVIKA